MNQQDWQIKNLALIKDRLRKFKAEPDGNLFFEAAGVQFVVVIKEEGVLRLVMVEQINPRTHLVQSWLELDDPLYLSAYYAQAVMLGITWPLTLNRACVIGLGGGRIPMLLHHYFPQSSVECVDIDSQVVKVAQEFFGLQFDERLTIAIQDGRDYLTQGSPQVRYDFILVDVFLGNGYTPYRLATREFFWLLQSCLSVDGVMVFNMLDNDLFYAHKIKTIQSVFPHVYICPTASNTVIFATQSQPLTKTELIQRAEAAQHHHQFSFPLTERAHNIKTGPELYEHIPRFDEAQILVDDSPPADYFDQLPSFNTVFSSVDTHAPCPCGSALPFGQCHQIKTG